MKNLYALTDWLCDANPELDLLTPYVNETGVYTDTDQDGIPDVVEIWFSNSSIVSSYEYKERFIDRFGSVLFNEYSWVIGYYKTVRSNQNESAAKQWLSNQFNPLIRDRTPPMITTFNLWWEVEYSLSLEPVKVYAHVHIVVRDAGGISYLHIVDEDSGEDVTVWNAGTVVEVDHKFSASLWQAGFGSVHIRVVAKDNAGNYISVEKELKGAFEQALDALKAIWDAIWNALKAVANAIMSAMNVVWEWIISHVMDLLNKALEPVISAVSGFASKILSMITAYLNQSRNPDPISVKDIFNAITRGGFFYMVLALCLAIQTISTFLTLYSMGLGALVGKAVSMVTVELAKELFKSMIVTTISLAGLTAIVAILYFYKPKDDPFWKEGIGLAVFNFAVEFAKAVKGFMMGDKSGVIVEALGLMLAIMSVIVAFYSTTIEVALVSLVLSGIGAAITWLNKDIFDRMIVAPLKHIEEIISVMALAYSIATLGTFS